MAGCALVVRAYDLVLLRLNALGLVVGLLTAITHMIYGLFNQKRVQTLNSWTSLTLMMGFSAIALAVLTLLSDPQALPLPRDSESLLVLILLGIGPTLGGYVSVHVASLNVVLAVPIATAIAIALLHERMEWPQIIGMGLVLVAAVLPLAGAKLSRHSQLMSQALLVTPNE